MCLYDTLSASINTAMLASVIVDDEEELDAVEYLRGVVLGGLFGVRHTFRSLDIVLADRTHFVCPAKEGQVQLSVSATIPWRSSVDIV